MVLQVYELPLQDDGSPSKQLGVSQPPGGRSCKPFVTAVPEHRADPLALCPLLCPPLPLCLLQHSTTDFQHRSTLMCSESALQPAPPLPTRASSTPATPWTAPPLTAPAFTRRGEFSASQASSCARHSRLTLLIPTRRLPSDLSKPIELDLLIERAGVYEVCVSKLLLCGTVREQDR